MSSIIQPNIVAFFADAAIAKGSPVKMGTDNKHVAKAVLASDKIIGVAQSAATLAEDVLEVAVIGGGAKGLAGGTISAGQPVTANASGQLVATTTDKDRIAGFAMEDAVSGDLFSMVVQLGFVSAT